MLSPYKVLDLSDERGQLCGQMLGDLGADVVLVEPPTGSSARRIAPFANGLEAPEHSLFFWGFNRNKRSVALDIERETDRTRLRELVRGADILIESFTPGYLDDLGLGYAALRELNPALVMVSISAFGQQGPKARWAANDLTVLAASGVLQITGDGDRPPTRIVVPQAFLHGAAEAAAGALVALWARERDGLGQHVDVSAQTATMLATQFFALCHAWGVTPLERVAGGMKVGPIVLKFVNPARDGHVSVTFFFGTSGGPFARRLMEVMHERGFVDAATRDKDWLNYTDLLMTGTEPASELLRCIDAIAAFTAQSTKDELFTLARERDLLIVPVATTADVARSEQLAAREYWVELQHDAAQRTVRYPGPFARFSKTPLRYRRAPPRLAEHQAEVLAAAPARRHAPRNTSHGPRRAALDGLKILDFMWVIAGPASTRMFADHGATVVHIESRRAVDAARTVQPFWQSQAGPERSSAFANVGAGKYGCVLNLRAPQARAVLRRLVEWADVVTDSFACGVMQRLGLDYPALCEWNPSIIAVSSCLNGQSGPHATLAGFGTMGAQMAGFGELAGWPDRAPAGPFGAYTDYVAPKFTVAAILAALDHRRRSGEGQYIDLSQSEAALHFIAPAMLDYTVNGHIMKRTGNSSAESCPHGVYPAQGEDCWVALAADNETQWQNLARVTGHDEWLTRGEFADLASRQSHHAELDAAIGAWTSKRSVADIETALQAVGVPVHRSSHSVDLFEDEQLAARQHFVTVPHPELGPIPIENSRVYLSDTPAQVTRPGPLYGEHNDWVLKELLGYNQDEIAALGAAGVFE
jgi:crotonobetainyl-CoA:carnitine CoA-transferase CaiB-like acyl-CoA transferase